MSDYLWDKSGEADGDIERLEELLGRLRHAGAAPELPFGAGTQASLLELKSHASTRAGLFGHAFFSRPARLAAAAGLLLAVLAGAFALMRMVKKEEGRASVGNEIQVAQPHAPEEAKPREEVSAPQVVSKPKESTTPESIQREPSRRNELVVSKSPVRSQRREAAPRETVASQTTRDVRRASSQGGVFEGRAPDADSRVRAKEQLVYALRLTSEALKEVRGRAKGVAATNAFDGRSPLR
ncbi:MAG TPA: hypothetical protein VGP08_00550 [Pyrinomonadaceae bacterium]|jgi:hypothetical protein|nr:hypothetical protein [Pyrinomonadaceae bacterium]